MRHAPVKLWIQNADGSCQIRTGRKESVPGTLNYHLGETLPAHLATLPNNNKAALSTENPALNIESFMVEIESTAKEGIRDHLDFKNLVIEQIKIYFQDQGQSYAGDVSERGYKGLRFQPTADGSKPGVLVLLDFARPGNYHQARVLTRDVA